MLTETFELPTDADEAEGLATIGIAVQPDMGEPALIAHASDMLRRQAWYNKEAARIEAMRDAELQMVAERYAKQITPLQDRATQLNTVVVQIAQMVDYGSKKKSLKIGFGTIGKRDKAERIEILDKEAAIAYAKLHAPGIVMSSTEYKVAHKDLSPIVLAAIKETGAVPAGFEHHSETTEYYAKPEEVE